MGYLIKIMGLNKKKLLDHAKFVRFYFSLNVEMI